MLQIVFQQTQQLKLSRRLKDEMLLKMLGFQTFGTQTPQQQEQLTDMSISDLVIT